MDHDILISASVPPLRVKFLLLSTRRKKKRNLIMSKVGSQMKVANWKKLLRRLTVIVGFSLA